MSKPQIGHASDHQNSVNSLLAAYEPVIGLEVHCQLKTKSKLFCACSTEFGALPNHNTCPICLGYPGVLPVVNKTAIDYAIRFALAVEATIHKESIFSRKQYFYPDLPKGFQITQYDRPYSTGGGISLSDGRRINLTRAHIEEDAGKNVHGDQSSYVDLNRAGIPLIEIVSEPEIRTPEDAADYLKRLRSLVRYLEICDGNLEEGSFRCDANISVRKKGATQFGTRCEIKNLNSFKNIERAIRFEIVRQIDVVESGGKVIQQTLQFDPASGKTRAMRSKEDAHDYRYFPEPDLRPLYIADKRVSEVRFHLPELPEQMSARFQQSYQLSDYDAKVLTSEKELALFYEEVNRLVADGVSSKIVANWVLSEFLREVNNREWDLAQPKVSAKNLADLLMLIGKGVISGKIAKTVFEVMVEEGGEPDAIVKAKGLVQVSDSVAIQKVIDQVVGSNQAQVDEFLSGKEKVFGFFVGQVMKLSGGKFNPGLVNELLREKLNAARR